MGVDYLTIFVLVKGEDSDIFTNFARIPRAPKGKVGKSVTKQSTRIKMKRNLLSRVGVILLSLSVGAMIFVSCSDNKKKQQEEEAAAAAAAAEAEAQAIQQKKEKDALELMSQLPEEPIFDIKTSLGTIKVKLYSDTPKHRDNFEKLALSGFYDGLLFHRVINGFMIQGGDPYSKDTTKVAQYGQGGPGYQIPAEILPNHSHKKGALAAARRGDAANPQRESSGSQFYLVQDEGACSSLDGQYTVFGETVDGLGVIDKIAAVPVSSGKNLPLNPVKIISITLDPASKPAPPQEEAPAQ